MKTTEKVTKLIVKDEAKRREKFITKFLREHTTIAEDILDENQLLTIFLH